MTKNNIAVRGKNEIESLSKDYMTIYGSKKEFEVKALVGQELGFGVMASQQMIEFVQDKLTLKPKGMLSLIMQSGLLTGMKEEWLERDGKFFGYKIWMERDGRFSAERSFDLDKAKRAGLLKPDSGWTKYPENMCQWRAIGFLADFLFPDIRKGYVTSEEMGATMTQDGDIVEGEIVASLVDTQLELIAKHGLNTVLAANGGKFPLTFAEIDMVERIVSGDEEE